MQRGTVWATFGCNNMGWYHDLYLRTDVLLLADVFEIFRKICLRQYGLDPAHYYTSSGLSWHALLKKTGVEIKLLTMICTSSLRSAISMVFKCYAKANNPDFAGYDPSKPNTHSLPTTSMAEQ